MKRVQRYIIGRTVLCLILFLCLLWLGMIRQGMAESQQSEVPFPPLTDDAEVLTDSQQTELQELLEAHNSAKLGRIFVLLIPKLPKGKTIEVYANEKINETPLQPEERNDRILIVVALKDRKLRIETSREVWKLLTDEECATIIQEQFVPQFRQGNYYQGIHDGIIAMISQLKEK